MPRDSAARELRDELRSSTDFTIRRRRGIVGLCAFSSAVLGGIALFQVGILKRLPDPPLPCFHADDVNGSARAYSLMRTPDALLGMASYAVTGCLAGMGKQDRWKTARWIPLAMGAKAICDAGMAGKLSVEQGTKFGKFSIWSLLVAGATFGTLALSMPEFKRALSRQAD
jgi:hypothetical protein